MGNGKRSVERMQEIIVSFTLQHLRSTKTLRFHYEFQFEKEQEILKRVYELRNDLREKGWTQTDSPKVTQTSFLLSEDSDGQLEFKFE